MRCGKVRSLMFNFFEENLSEKDMVQIREHLKDCPWCASEYRKAKKIFDNIHEEPIKVVPEQLHKNIMEDVKGMNSFIKEEKREVKHKTMFALRRVATACCAIFAVCLIFYFVDFGALKNKGQETLMKMTAKEESLEDDGIFNLFATNRMTVKDESVKEDSLESDLSSILYEEEKSVTTSSNSSIEKEAKKDDKKEKKVDKSTKEYLEELITKKGFQTSDNYMDVYDTDSDVTKKSLLELYTVDIERSIKDANKYIEDYEGEIYYSNVSYNEDDEYRTCTMALRVNGDNFKVLKEKLETLGKYDINVTQDELKIETEEDLNKLLIECRDKKLELENELENLDSSSSNYENKKYELNEQIDAQKRSIENIEESLEKKKDKVELVKIELILKECSELELEGIISQKTFGISIIKAFKSGWIKFVRLLQDIFLWICEYILEIIFFVIMFIIIFYIIRAFLLKERD